MTMRATGIKIQAPRLATNGMQMGQATEGLAGSGIRAYARMEQEREETNEEIKAANKGGLARLGGAAGGVVGGIAGTVFGGPAGGYAGAMIGSAAGGLLGGML